MKSIHIINVFPYNFIISDNFLTTLENCPEYVGGDFVCDSNRFSTLEYCPNYVGGTFKCSQNSKVNSLNYLPENLNVLLFDFCNVKTLENNSTLKKVNSISLEGNYLTNLKGFPVVTNSVNVGNNNLDSLDGIPNKRFYDFNVSDNRKLVDIYTSVQIREMYRIRGILTYEN